MHQPETSAIQEQRSDGIAIGLTGLLLGLLVASYFLRFINSDLHKWLLPEWSREFSTSVADLGMVTVAITLPWGLAAPLLGPFSDRYGRKPLLVVGLLLAGLSSALTALAWDFNSLLFFRFLAGVGGAASAPAAITVIGDLCPPEKRGRPMGFLFAGEALGALFGVPAITWVAGTLGWKSAFLVEGALYAPLVLALALLVRFPRWEPKSSGWIGDLGSVLRDGWAMSLLVVNSFVQVAFFVADTYLPAYLRLTYDLSLTQAVPVTYILAIGTLVGALGGGPLADRFSKFWGSAALAMITGILGVVAFLVTTNLWLAVAIVAAFRAVHYAYRPVYTCIVTQVQIERRGTVLGLNGTSNNVGTAAGSALGIWVLGMAGYLPLGIAGLVMALIPGAGLPLLRRRRPPTCVG